MQFLVYSESSDIVMFNNFLNVLATIDKHSEIDDINMQKIHILVHYLKIKRADVQVGR
jgi:hypothetical protein